MSEPKDGDHPHSEPTAVIVYKAPSTPAPIPTFFATDPPAIEADKIETPAIDAAPGAHEGPAMPRAATLGNPPGADAASASTTSGAEAEPALASNPAVAKEAPRTYRFTLLAASVAIAASLGAVIGSLGFAQIQQVAGVTPAPRAEAHEDVRALKEAVAQMRANIKSLNDNLAAMRAAATASSQTITGQLTKIAEAVERGDRHAVAPATPLAPAPDTTGSVSISPGVVAPGAKPAIVEGWVVRKVYDGAALIEGRYGIVEVEPGMTLPGIGRIQEIRRQDGRWVVVTPKGLIVSAH